MFTMGEAKSTRTEIQGITTLRIKAWAVMVRNQTPAPNISLTSTSEWHAASTCYRGQTLSSQSQLPRGQQR